MDQELFDYIELQSNRLYFRNLRVDDVHELHAIFEHPEVDAFVTMFEDTPSFEDVLFYIAETLKTQTGGIRDFHWVLENDGELVGLIRLEKEQRNPFQFSVGYCINPKYWNRGFATEALREVLDFAFEIEGTTSVEVTTFSENTSSKRVAEKSGFKHTGTLRDNYLKNGIAHDVDIYSVLRSEWELLKK